MISAAIERCAGIDVGKKFFERVCDGGAIEGEAPDRDAEVRYDPIGTRRVTGLAAATRKSVTW
jgi:hypothetical protein